MEKKKLAKIGLISLIFGGMYLFPPTHKKVMELETQVEELERQIGSVYYGAARNLEISVEELSKIDFTKELTEKEEKEISLLIQEYDTLYNILFYSNNEEIALTEWKDKMSEVEDYLFNHVHGKKLTEEEVYTLEQGLQAIRFIARDFQDMRFVDNNDSYKMMHDKEHEMVERIKYRLSLKY